MGERIGVAIFYLSDRGIAEGLMAATARGAGVRVLTDRNEYAFGRERSGVPVRWCDTHGGQ